MRVDLALGNYYVAQGVATLAQTSVGTGDDLPTTDGPFLTISGTGGEPREGTHNAGSLRLPHFQIVARARSYSVAANMAEAAYEKSDKANLLLTGGVFIINMHPINDPFPLPKDANGRNRVAFNVEVRARQA